MDLVDIWYDRMRKVAKNPPPMTADDMPEVEGFGRMLMPHNDPDGVPNPHATDFNRLPAAERDRQRTRLRDRNPLKRKLTVNHLVKNLVDLHHQFKEEDPEGYENDKNFYHEAHQHVLDISKATGYHPRHVAGAIAAMSPRADWDENLATAKYLAHNLHHFSHMDNPMEAADAVYNKGRSEDLRTEAPPTKSTGEAPKARWSTGSTNHAKAVRILRGEDPDHILGGHKVRSFFNNIIDPHNHSGMNDVTMDRHAVSAALKASLGDDSMKAVFGDGSSRPANTKGTYSLFAHAYRKAHKKLVDEGHLSPDEHPSHLQARIWGGWRRHTKNQRDNSDGRSFPYYAHLASVDPKPEELGPLIDPYEGDDSEPDPDIWPEENQRYWERFYEEWPPKQAAAHKHQSPSINNSPKQGYGLDSETEHSDPEGGGMLSQAVYYPLPHHLGTDMDEFLFEAPSRHAVLEDEPEGALPYTEADDSESAISREASGECPWCRQRRLPGEELGEDPIFHKHCEDEMNSEYDDAPGEVGTRPIHPSEYLSHPDRATNYGDLAELMSHTRKMPLGTPHMNALQAEATEGTGMAGNWSMDTDQPYSHGGQTPNPNRFGDGTQYREDQEGNPKPSSWWQQEHSTSAENPASTGPQSFGDTLDPAEYPFAHGQTKPDESLLAPGPSLTSMTFGPQWGFDYMASLAPSLKPYLPMEAAALPEDPFQREYRLEDHLVPDDPSGNQYSSTSDEPAKRPEETKDYQTDSQFIHQHRLNSLDTQRPAWLAPGGSQESHEASVQPHSKADNSDIAKAARAHLAALSASEQDELIHEGEKEGVLASNYDLLDLRGTHYAALEEEFQRAEVETDDLFW